MLICVSVYHNACSVDNQPQLWCDSTRVPFFFFFLKGVLNGVNTNWPFVSQKHRQLCGTCRQILNELLGFLGFHDLSSTSLHLETPRPLSPSRLEVKSLRSGQPLAEPCFCSRPPQLWVTEKWCERWLLSGCSARETIHCLALCGGCQSVRLSTCHSKIRSRTSLNKTARQ